MHKKSVLYRLLFVLPLSFIMMPILSGCSGSQASAYTIISISEGDVQIKKTDSTEWIKAEAKAVLVESDTVKTGANSKATITFFDGSTIDLKPNTQIEIRELVQEKTTGILLKQEIGETLSKVEQLADSASRYEIETPVAVAGVRGSQMLVNVAVNGTTLVQNVEGKISVTAQGTEILIPEGNTSTVEPGQPPSTPVPSNVHVNSDGTEDLFDLQGKSVSGYQYLDIVNEWIERDGEYWAITIELNADYPSTVDSAGLVEWDVVIDADNDISTGWQSSLLFNDLGIDYYLSLSRTGTDFYINAQRTSDSSTNYNHTLGYNASGNKITIRFKPDAIENSSKFSFIVLARQYSIVGDPLSLLAADKIPDNKHFMIATASP